MDLARLKTLIETPPYDAMSDAELIVALNAPTVAVQESITKSKMLMWAAMNGGFTAIEAACDYSAGSPAQNHALKNAGFAAKAMFFGGDVSEFDTGSAVNIALLDLFVTFNLITQNAIDELLGMGRVMKTPAAVYEVGGYVNLGDILEARAL